MNAKKVIVLLLAAIMIAAGFAACGQSGNEQASTASEGDAVVEAVPEDDGAGFEEFPIGDDHELGPLNVAGVYFQPVDMEPLGSNLPASEADCHIEADISALENDLGYGVGDFVPWLKVDYEFIKSDGTVASSGTFMPMSASDGPHYGANVKFGDAGTYTVR
ncbi:MAG: iron transporter, partial [Treponema sp.]|nr:iron transporter [Treponema sp.]